MLKILSWNIRQGGGSRVSKICDSLIDYGAQIVILSEFRNNKSGDLIRKQLLKNGFLYQTISGAQGNDNSVAIFSMLECEHVQFPECDPVYPHNIVAARYSAFTVYGLYLPHKKKHVLFDFLLSEINDDRSRILAGDFNTGKNYIDQEGNSFWYTDKLIELEDKDYFDAFRHSRGYVKEYSWYSHQGNGYRYDHTYIHRAIEPIVKDCYYLHQWREDKLSDHSPMVLELG